MSGATTLAAARARIQAPELAAHNDARANLLAAQTAIEAAIEQSAQAGWSGALRHDLELMARDLRLIQQEVAA